MVEFFIDTANVKEIKEILPWGILSGVYHKSENLFL